MWRSYDTKYLHAIIINDKLLIQIIPIYNIIIQSAIKSYVGTRTTKNILKYRIKNYITRIIL